MTHGPNYSKEFSRDAMEESERAEVRKHPGAHAPRLAVLSHIASRLNNALGGAHKGLEIGDRRMAVDAVTEVDDVSLTAARGPATTRRFRHLIRRPFSQEFLVHISLEDQFRIVSAGG